MRVSGVAVAVVALQGGVGAVHATAIGGVSEGLEVLLGQLAEDNPGVVVGDDVGVAVFVAIELED